MDILIATLTFLKDNAIALGVLGTSIAAIINIAINTSLRRNELKQQRFENYHALVDRLNSPEESTGHHLLDKQKSAVYEMRFYEEYKDLTARLLSSWIERGVTFDGIADETLRYLNLPTNE